MKTINLNGEEYVKLSHYEKLEKTKKKIVKEEVEVNKIITNPEQVLGVIDLGDAKYKNGDIILAGKLGHYIETSIEDIKMLDSIGEIFNPRMKFGENTYRYHYFEQAKRIADAFGLRKDFNLYIKKGLPDYPLLMTFSNIGIIIAPRIESERETNGGTG